MPSSSHPNNRLIWTDTLSCLILPRPSVKYNRFLHILETGWAEGAKSPPVKNQIIHSHPLSFGYVLLSELPNQRLRHRVVLQELTTSQDHHALLAPRKHNVRPPAILHEPRLPRPDDRNYDMVFFISLERVNVKHCVFPDDVRILERVFYRISLSVVRSDDSEVFAFVEVTGGDSNCGFDFAFILNEGKTFSMCGGPVFGKAAHTVQLTPLLTSSPLRTSTKRQQVGI